MDRSKIIHPDDIQGQPYIFVSYSRNDLAQIQEILQILKRNRFRFWYDMGLKSGVEWAEEIGNRIEECDQFLVFISQNSINSKYVRKEISLATEKDKNILAVYLEEAKLTSGLQLLLGDIQAIRKPQFSDTKSFEHALCEAASHNTLYQIQSVFEDSVNNQSEGGAKNELLQTYELYKQIGAGGISQVFFGMHKRTRIPVTIKCGIIDDSYTGLFTKKSFVTEKMILSVISPKLYPHIPVILDWFEDEKKVFLVESWIDGKTLDTEHSYSEQEVVDIAKNVLKILHYLHENEIIYRDIKPANLIQNQHGDIYLIDFGTSLFMNQCREGTISALGTVGFAAPEQYFSDRQLNPATDIYALGRTLEKLLCPTSFEKAKVYPIRYYRKDISLEFEAILEKMTELKQQDRYQKAIDVLNALENYKKRSFFSKLKLYIKSWNKICRINNERKKTLNLKYDTPIPPSIQTENTVILESEYSSKEEIIFREK